MFKKITVAGLSADENATLNLLAKQLDDRARRNLLRASYYDGKRAIRQVGSVVPAQYYNLAIVLGWSAKAVDILARRCNLDGFVWDGGSLDDLGRRELDDEVNLSSVFGSGIVESLIHGVSFLVNTKGIGDEPRSLIHVKTALDATGEWNGRTQRLDNLLSVTDRDDKSKPSGMVLYLDGVTITVALAGGRWSVVDRSFHGWGVPAEPLVYKPRAGRPFGTSRISRPVMALHDMALRTVIRMEGNADVYSIPQMWLLGADDSIFKNADGSQKASFQMILGRMFGIPDNEGADNPRAEVRQFSAASPQPHIDQLKQQAQLFSGETSIPLASLGVSDMANPISADSYIASREDLIAEAEGATDDWTPAVRRCFVRALAIWNGETGVPAEWRTMDPKWRSPVYLSRAAAADAGSKQLAAVPWLADTEVGLELLGLDEQQIRRAMTDKRRAEARGTVAALIGGGGAVAG